MRNEPLRFWVLAGIGTMCCLMFSCLSVMVQVPDRDTAADSYFLELASASRSVGRAYALYRLSPARVADDTTDDLLAIAESLSKSVLAVTPFDGGHNINNVRPVKQFGTALSRAELVSGSLTGATIVGWANVAATSPWCRLLLKTVAAHSAAGIIDAVEEVR